MSREIPSRYTSPRPLASLSRRGEMPAWEDVLTAEEIEAVVSDERSVLTTGGGS